MKFINENNRIYVKDENDKIIVYALIPFKEENVIDVRSVFVDQSLRGRGVAHDLMLEVYNYAKENNYKVINTCPYAIKWFEKYTDKQDVLK